MPRHPAPKFTKQHYDAIAALIAQETTDAPNTRGWVFAPSLIDAFVEMFDDDNARFSADRFRIACGYPADLLTKEDNA